MRTAHASSRVVPALALLALGLAGCQSPDTSGQRSEGFGAPDQEMVYQASAAALEQQGFTVDTTASSASKGVLTTRQKLSMQPFSMHGYRDKATVKIEEVDKHPGFFTVSVNVIREFNDNQTQPSNPIKADWGRSQRVPELENLIKSRVEMTFIAPEPSDEFRNARGLPAGNSGRLPGLRTEGPERKEGWMPGK